MQFSLGDLRAFAAKIVLDLRDANVDIGPEQTRTVHESLIEILPYEETEHAEDKR